MDAALTEHIYSVARSMRARDREEFIAVSSFTTHDQMVEALVDRYAGHPDVIVAGLPDDPIVIGGLIQHRPNVATLLCFATDRFPEIGADLTRFIKQRLFPGYIAKGVHRIECTSLDGYEEVHRWIEALGLKREAVMPKFGRGGETYVQFAWTS